MPAGNRADQIADLRKRVSQQRQAFREAQERMRQVTHHLWLAEHNRLPAPPSSEALDLLRSLRAVVIRDVRVANASLEEARATLNRLLGE